MKRNIILVTAIGLLLLNGILTGVVIKKFISNSEKEIINSEVDTKIIKPSFIEVYTRTNDAVCICAKIYNEVNVSTSGTVDWETTYNVLVRKAVEKVFSEYQLKDFIKNSSSIVQEIRMEIGYNLEPYFADITYDIHDIDLVIPKF